ncbi:tetratricopeptide repeat protein [Geodermatophilus sp. URMC 61]|uniref:tetratricopeptide repeat protein n=1 Tax=Geodermatophilus sp. URMC 61 TaxID=3423411 RepID=UPI00406CDE21
MTSHAHTSAPDRRDHPGTATRLDHLATTLSTLGRPPRALPLEERALAITEVAIGAELDARVGSPRQHGAEHRRRGADWHSRLPCMFDWARSWSAATGIRSSRLMIPGSWVRAPSPHA